jgi:hypothetical protein
MSDTLLPCDSCHRHLRAGTSQCPFCDAAVRPSAAVTALCLGAALAASLAAPSEALAQSPRILLAQAPAAAYGAPPVVDPLLPGAIYERRPGAIVRPPTITVQVRDVELRGEVDPAAARRALLSASSSLRRCADLARREGVSSIRAQVEVSPQGRVTVREVEGVSPRVQACVAPTLRRMNLGRTRGTVSATISLRVGVGAPPNGPACPGPNPAGCRETGCGPGMVCDTRAACRPSSCACTANGWTCTSDCGGGVCRPANLPRPRPRPLPVTE